MTRNGYDTGLKRDISLSMEPHCAVLLSRRLSTMGLDLTALRDWLQSTLPGVVVHIMPDSGPRGSEIGGFLGESGAERLVLGLVRGEYSAVEVQTQARKAGLDPLGVQVLDLDAKAALLGPEQVSQARARLLLAGSVAKARAFSGTRPEHAKAGLSLATSRRALFSLAIREYSVVPSVLSARCAADRGCRRCVEACPRGALLLRGQQVELNRARCESCGVCLSACPWDALECPGQSFSELEACVAALLDPALADLSPRGVLFACQRTGTAFEDAVRQGFRYPTGWLPVVVPCTGMLSPLLLLRAIALGAAGVGIVPCGEQCPFQQDAVVEQRVSFCRDLLARMGASPDQVKLLPLEGNQATLWAIPPLPSVSHGAPLPGQAPASAGALRAGVEALLALVRMHGAPSDLSFEHAQSPLGIVELDARRCTGCEACSSACPSGALANSREGNTVSLSFDARLCTGCELCVPRCPEEGRTVLRVRRSVDVHQLAQGRSIIYTDQKLRCHACGAPVASTALLARIAELLGNDYAALDGTIARYCSDCRVTAPALHGNRQRGL